LNRVTSTTLTPECWKRRAEEMRALAQDEKYEEIKREMLGLAERYERLAHRVHVPRKTEDKN
jgi:hypothetical protein